MSNYSRLVTYVLFFNDADLDYIYMQFPICWTRERPPSGVSGLTSTTCCIVVQYQLPLRRHVRQKPPQKTPFGARMHQRPLIVCEFQQSPTDPDLAQFLGRVSVSLLLIYSTENGPRHPHHRHRRWHLCLIMFTKVEASASWHFFGLTALSGGLIVFLIHSFFKTVYSKLSNILIKVDIVTKWVGQVCIRTTASNPDVSTIYPSD